MENINIIAILVSPVIAVLVSIWVQNRIEKLRMRRSIFASLMSTRHQIAHSEEIVRALNMIDVVFFDQEKIRRLWREYFEMLHNPSTIDLWDKKKGELIAEMATVTRYRHKITLQDVQRVYAPVGMAEDLKKAREIADEMLRVLKESKGLRVAPKDESKAAPAPSGEERESV